MEFKKNKNFVIFLLLLTSLSLFNFNFTKAQGEENLTVEYNEYLETYVLSSGDSIHHWEIYEQGSGKIDFPINLPNPNISSAAIIDSSIIITVVESNPLPLDLGLFAGQYGGYMYNDLGRDLWMYGGMEEWRYGYSNVLIEICLQYDDLANLTSGYEFRDDVLDDFESIFGNKFYPYNSDPVYGEGGGNWWSFQYSLNLADYGYIFNSFLNNFPLGKNLLPNYDRFEKSPNKAIRINAKWDEFDPFPATEESELRWEYEADINLYESNTVSINQEGSTQIYFRELLDKPGDIAVEEWVNDSNYNIYLYKGAKITDVDNPRPAGSGQDSAHIYREMDPDGDVSGFLPDSAHFNFTHGNGLIPIIDCQITVDDTTVSFDDTIIVTKTITNVGNVTAYNIETTQPGPDFLDEYNFNYSMGDLFGTIDELEPEEVNITSMEIVCNHNETLTREYYVNLYFDATMNPDLDDHFSEPQFGGDRYEKSSNIIQIHHNNDTAEPWFKLDYEISNYYPSVGDEITVDVSMTNIGDVDAENIYWDVDPFTDGGHDSPIGYNTTNQNGMINRINSGESAQISVKYIAEAYNHYFGSETGISCDLTFSPFNESNILYMDSDDEDDNDAGSTTLLILPKQDVIIGPILNVDVQMSPIEGISGEFLNLLFNITNLGSSMAFDINPNAAFQYQGAPEDYNLVHYSGYNLFGGSNLGNLSPGESFIFSTKLLLLTNISMANFSINPFVSYDYSEEGTTNGVFDCYATPLNFDFEEILDEESNGVNATRVWMIIAFVAIGTVGVESTVLYRKFKHI